MLPCMDCRSPGRALLVIAFTLASLANALAVPLGYRYVGSCVVSQGRVVYWYWNADHVDIDAYRVSFVARLYARAVDVNQERPFIAIVRCDSKTYRGTEAQGPYVAIEDGEPIEAVFRAGCDGGKALNAAQRNARLNGATDVATAPAAAPPAAIATAEAIPVAAKSEPADPRRVDACIKIAETKAAPAGDALMTNTCAFPVEVSLCYKGGGGGHFDCPSPARGRHGDSLPPGATHVLPEYRRGTNKGINVVACRGAVGTVFPRLDEAGART